MHCHIGIRLHVSVNSCVTHALAKCYFNLTVQFRYRPYKSASMQILSCCSAGFLVAICGLLLRSQALISGARSPNFDPKDPSSESRHLSDDLSAVIFFLVLFLSAPAIMTIILASNSKLKKYTALVFRLRLASLFEWFKKRRSQKIAPEVVKLHQEKSAAVLVSAAILFSKQKGRNSKNLSIRGGGVPI